MQDRVLCTQNHLAISQCCSIGECRLTRRDARRQCRRRSESRCTPTEEPSTGRSRSHGRRRGRTRQYITPAWKRNPQLTGPRATRGSEDRATKGLKVMQYWRLPATECADKAAPRNHHSRKTLTTGYPETGKPRPHSRMTEASALEGQPRRGREYADMQVPKYPHIGSPKLTSGNAFVCFNPRPTEAGATAA